MVAPKPGAKVCTKADCQSNTFLQLIVGLRVPFRTAKGDAANFCYSHDIVTMLSFAITHNLAHHRVT